MGSLFFTAKSKACICLGDFCGVVGGQGTTLLWCVGLVSFSGCSWSMPGVTEVLFGFLRMGTKGCIPFSVGNNTPTHTVGSANPSYHRAFICSSCSPVEWDSGCRVIQLFLATSITGMCVLGPCSAAGAVVRGRGQSLFVLLPPATSSQPAKLFVNRHQHHLQVLSVNTQARI